jgi:integral membrane protein (TIGR01906 family)
MTRLRSVGFLLITLVIPAFLVMSAIRILLIPFIYVDFEYRQPGFPPDTYGFTMQDRLKWSKVSIDYLLNDQGIDWLTNQKLADGSPLYNDRELSHMLDVKNLIQAMFLVWWILLVGLVLVGLASWRLKGLRYYWKAISNGGWLTIALIVAIMIFVVLSFDSLFTDFHLLFFSGDTWLFLYSDDLIRLFPIQLWQDAFIWMGVLSSVFALLLGYFGRLLSKRQN